MIQFFWKSQYECPRRWRCDALSSSSIDADALSSNSIDADAGLTVQRHHGDNTVMHRLIVMNGYVYLNGFTHYKLFRTHALFLPQPLPPVFLSIFRLYCSPPPLPFLLFPPLNHLSFSYPVLSLQYHISPSLLFSQDQSLSSHGSKMASLPLDPIFAHLLIKSHELGYAHSRLCCLPVNVYLTSQIIPLFLSLYIVLECESHSEVPPILIVYMFVSMHLS